jgi:hypothetical protein
LRSDFPASFSSLPTSFRFFFTSRSEMLPSSERAKALTKALRRTLAIVATMPAFGFSIVP